MTAPISNGPTTTRLHHYAGHYCGETQARPDGLHGCGAHPRVGGENAPATTRIARPGGSSPRGRGKHFGGRDALPALGLIPAWAGKTAVCRRGTAAARAHPRVGGENHKRRIIRALTRGLIPAWAGKTVDKLCTIAINGAHPRVGGENVMRA